MEVLHLDGKSHSFTTIGIGFGFLGAALGSQFGLEPVQIAISALGCANQLIYSGDSDVDQGFIGDYFIRSIMGTDLFFDLWLDAYRQSYKHRSKWSHWPFLGTLNRLLYLLFPPIVLFNADQDTSKLKLATLLIFPGVVAFGFWVLLGLLTNLNVNIAYWAIPWIWGMIIADTAHWIADNIRKG